MTESNTIKLITKCISTLKRSIIILITVEKYTFLYITIGIWDLEIENYGIYRKRLGEHEGIY